MATDRSVVKGTPPDMTRAAFVAELARAKSPAASSGGAVYDRAVKRELSPAFLLGIFAEESGYGTNPKAICVGGGGVPEATYSWGNTTENDGKPSFGGTGRVVRGRFSVYDGWEIGGTSTIDRLFDFAPYVPLRTVREIITQFAPPEENRTEEYIAGVVETMNRLGKGAAMVRIAVSSGHHNTDGGNRFEYETVGELAEAIARAARYQGIDVWVPQPDGPDADTDRGDGDYAGGLQAVARAVVAEHQRSPFAVFLECHTQGGPKQRGVFGIYPDMRGDLDTDARDNLIPRIVRKVRDYTGIPIWSTGLLPESRTGVGLGGSRLGVFYASEGIKADCTRLLIEYGAHDTPEDAKIHRTPQFYTGAARATIEGICEFLERPIRPWDEATKPEPAPARPPGYIMPGEPDVFTWPGAEGVIVARESTWYNPEKKKYYKLTWHHERGFTADEIL